MIRVRNFDPAAGQAFQGDIAIVPIPASIEIRKLDEIVPTADKLIIQEGEATGHHHAIDVSRQRRFRDVRAIPGDPTLSTRDPRLHRALKGAARNAPDNAIARIFRDPTAVAALQGAGILTRADLAIGCLVVEGGNVVIAHDEHDGIRVPPGNYYLGRQVESAGAEERVVQD